MIRGWRSAFASPQLPFFYVELCTQYNMPGFWAAQRAALSLGNVGFATTTDIQVSIVELSHHKQRFQPVAERFFLCVLVQRELHPPDKQDVAARLMLEMRRVALHERNVISRGPEVIAQTVLKNGSVLVRMSNLSLTVSAGILTGCAGCTPLMVGHQPTQRYVESCQANCSVACEQAGPVSGVFSITGATVFTPVPYAILGAKGEVMLHPQQLHDPLGGGVWTSGARSISLNADDAHCFLYGKESGLPAPPTTIVYS